MIHQLINKKNSDSFKRRHQKVFTRIIFKKLFFQTAKLIASYGCPVIGAKNLQRYVSGEKLTAPLRNEMCCPSLGCGG